MPVAPSRQAQEIAQMQMKQQEAAAKNFSQPLVNQRPDLPGRFTGSPLQQIGAGSSPFGSGNMRQLPAQRVGGGGYQNQMSIPDMGGANRFGGDPYITPQIPGGGQFPGPTPHMTKAAAEASLGISPQFLAQKQFALPLRTYEAEEQIGFSPLGDISHGFSPQPPPPSPFGSGNMRQAVMGQPSPRQAQSQGIVPMLRPLSIYPSPAGRGSWR